MKNLFYAAGTLFFLVATVLLLTGRTEAQYNPTPSVLAGQKVTPVLAGQKVASFQWIKNVSSDKFTRVLVMTEDGTLYSRYVDNIDTDKNLLPDASYSNSTLIEIYGFKKLGNFFTK